MPDRNVLNFAQKSPLTPGDLKFAEIDDLLNVLDASLDEGPDEGESSKEYIMRVQAECNELANAIMFLTPAEVESVEFEEVEAT